MLEVQAPQPDQIAATWCTGPPLFWSLGAWNSFHMLGKVVMIFLPRTTERKLTFAEGFICARICDHAIYSCGLVGLILAPEGRYCF